MPPGVINGASPRRPGFKMAVPGNEEQDRTISLSPFPLGGDEGMVGVIEDVTGR